MTAHHVVSAKVLMFKDLGYFADAADSDRVDRYIHLRLDGYCEQAIAFLPDGTPLDVFVRVPAPAEIAPGTQVTAIALTSVSWNWKACLPEHCKGCQNYCRRSGISIRQATLWVLADRMDRSKPAVELVRISGVNLGAQPPPQHVH